MTMTMTYTLENAAKSCTEITPEDFAELDALNDFAFSGAMDLPDGTEFARGRDADGKPITVYRSESH